ncbi:MAG: hypothetical protein ALAOOOJD_02034 [bacterium]|nr:hypothetical protein [bacterium]
MLRQRDDAEGFRGVVAPVNHIEMIFLAKVIARVARLAGEIRVNAGGNGLRQQKSAAAAHNGQALDGAGAKKIRAHRIAECRLQALQKLGWRNGGFRFGEATNVSSMMIAESGRRLEPQTPRQHRVVADFGVGVERQMRAVQIELGFDQFFHPAKMRADNFFRLLPKQAVVHEQQIEVPGGCCRDSFLAGIDRGRYALNFFPSLYLQTVLRIVGKLADLQVRVEITD